MLNQRFEFGSTEANGAGFRTHRALWAHARDLRDSFASPPHWLHPVRRPHFIACFHKLTTSAPRHTRDWIYFCDQYPALKRWAIFRRFAQICVIRGQLLLRASCALQIWKVALRARMRLRVGFFQPLDRDVGVNLGCGKIGMPEQRLDAS